MTPSRVAIGLVRVVLHLPSSNSLKFKRQIVSGLLRRLRQELKVSAAEVVALLREIEGALQPIAT